MSLIPILWAHLAGSIHCICRQVDIARLLSSDVWLVDSASHPASRGHIPFYLCCYTYIPMLCNSKTSKIPRVSGQISGESSRHMERRCAFATFIRPSTVLHSASPTSHTCTRNVPRLDVHDIMMNVFDQPFVANRVYGATWFLLIQHFHDRWAPSTTQVIWHPTWREQLNLMLMKMTNYRQYLYWSLKYNLLLAPINLRSIMDTVVEITQFNKDDYMTYYCEPALIRKRTLLYSSTTVFNPNIIPLFGLACFCLLYRQDANSPIEMPTEGNTLVFL